MLHGRCGGAAVAITCLLLLFVPSPTVGYVKATSAWSLRGAGQLSTTNNGDDHDVSTTGRPWFCRGLDCPSYDVIETKGSLQLRRYKSQCFLVTKVEAHSLLEGQIIATKRFAGYLAGENEDRVKLPPTVPLNTVLLTADRKSETVKGKFFFAIYLPDEVQDDAPKPDNREVKLVRLRKRAVWVDTFDCPFLTESAIITRGWQLIKDLQDMKRKVDTRFFVFSLYEPPLPFVPHHYEIAVLAKCRKRGDPVPLPTPDNDDDDDPIGDDDDYPFPEEAGGDADDDECDSDSPTFMNIVKSL